MKSEFTPHILSNSRLSKELKAIYHAIRLNVPFAAYQYSNEKGNKIHFLAQLPGKKSISDNRFIINFWNEPSSNAIVIKDTVTIDDFINNLPAQQLTQPLDVLPQTDSTSYLLYKGQVMSIIDDLKNIEIEGKTVLSRIDCGSIPEEDSTAIWTEIIYNYFKELSGTFRYVYYTPETALWLGASPEILLNVDKQTGESCTMSLAGTKRVHNTLWDEKNYAEHFMVTRYIGDVLSNLGINYKYSKTEDVKFFTFHHLCDIFNFNIGNLPIESIIDAINPTPALAGYPVNEAIERLSHLEIHQRYCYGGYVAIDTDHSFNSYVNIRCMHFYGNSYCQYMGGGILAKSNPDSEWRETESKGEMLKCIISGAKALANRNKN